jgi:PAS domain S-box-containing protein
VAGSSFRAVNGAPASPAGADDPADRTALERALRTTTARFEALMRNAPVGCAFIDSDLRFQLVNDRLAEIDGFAASEHVGRAVDDVLPDLAAVNAVLFPRVLAGESVLEAEVHGATRAGGGHGRDWLVSYYPLRGPSDEVSGIGAALVDVTERNELLAAARDAAARANELQRFAAAMARAATVDAVVRVVVDRSAAAVDADVVNVVMRLHGENELRIYHSTATDPSARAAWPTMSLEDAMPIADSLRHGHHRYFVDRDEFVAHSPGLARDIAIAGMQAVATLPLRSSDGTVIGGMALAYTTPQSFEAAQRLRLQTVVDIAAQSLDRARLYERERDVARTLQLALLPSALPVFDNVSIETRYVPGGTNVAVGGDWYDVVRFADGRIGLLIGDAAGRGVEAATFMGKARNAAAALAIDHSSPATLLARVNQYLSTVPSRRSMATCCCVVLDPESGTLCYATAGHPAPLLSNRAGVRFLEGARGLPLGVVPDAKYLEAEITLDEPSILLLYTDGLIERRDESIDVGLTRLRDTVAALGADDPDLCQHLADALLPDGADDDVALLVATVTPTSAKQLRLHLPADAVHLSGMRGRVTEWLDRMGLDRRLISEMVLALNEAVTNSALHAYANTDAPGDVDVALALEPRELIATVIDAGRWRQPPDAHDGFGLALMHELMTEVTVERSEGGTLVRMRRVVD